MLRAEEHARGDWNNMFMLLTVQLSDGTEQSASLGGVPSDSARDYLVGKVLELASELELTDLSREQAEDILDVATS
jgi:hypothetical protein